MNSTDYHVIFQKRHFKTTVVCIILFTGKYMVCISACYNNMYNKKCVCKLACDLVADKISI